MQKEMEYKLRYEVVSVQLDQQTRLTKGMLEIPSELPPCYDHEERVRSPVVFNVLDLNEENTFCLSMMRVLGHRNILKAKTVMESDSDSKARELLAWVEPYNGTLLDYLQSTNFGAPVVCVGEKIMLPTDEVQNIIRQIVDGIEHLKIHGYYHGNFSLENTFYKYESNGDLTVKLANFKKHNTRMTRSCYQVKDWHDVGLGLMHISDIAKKLNSPVVDTRFFCCHLYDLAQKMMQFVQGDLDTAHQKVVQNIFFWRKLERKKFFVYRIPMALDDKAFTSALEKCNDDLCSLPWNANDNYDGLIQKMERYRSSKNQPALDTETKRGFVKFISGCYTHEVELVYNVDKIIQLRHPLLCWKLNSILPKSDVVWL